MKRIYLVILTVFFILSSSAPTHQNNIQQNNSYFKSTLISYTINGTSNPGTRITITSDLEDYSDFKDYYYVSEQGYFQIHSLQLPERINASFELDGFITYSRNDIALQNFPTNVQLTSVRVSGVVRPNSTVVVNCATTGTEVERNHNVGSTGEFEFFELLDGEYILTVSSIGFKDYSAIFDVNRNHVNISETSIEMEPVSIDGTALPGSIVQLWRLAAKLDYIIIGECGSFSFNAIETKTPIYNATFRLVAILERHITQTEYITIENNMSDSHDFVTIQEEQVASIYGVTSQRTNVYLYKDDELIDYVVTGTDGIFTFSHLYNGVYTIILRRGTAFEEYSREIVIDYNNGYFGTQFLPRVDAGNFHIGIIIQVFVVSSLVALLWFIYRDRKAKTISKK